VDVTASAGIAVFAESFAWLAIHNAVPLPVAVAVTSHMDESEQPEASIEWNSATGCTAAGCTAAGCTDCTAAGYTAAGCTDCTAAVLDRCRKDAALLEVVATTKTSDRNVDPVRIVADRDLEATTGGETFLSDTSVVPGAEDDGHLEHGDADAADTLCGLLAGCSVLVRFAPGSVRKTCTVLAQQCSD